MVAKPSSTRTLSRTSAARSGASLWAMLDALEDVPAIIEMEPQLARVRDRMACRLDALGLDLTVLEAALKSITPNDVEAALSLRRSSPFLDRRGPRWPQT